MDGYSYLLGIHITCGFTALISGIITMATEKGSTKHILIGRIYFYAMFGVFLTSTAMFIFKPTQLLFLFLIGIFSFYNTLSGVRLLFYKNAKINSRKSDWLIASFVFCAGLTMIALGIYEGLRTHVGQAILYLVFGFICSKLSGSDLSFLVNQDKGINKTGAHLSKHISRMGGSYIATFTAFVVVNNFLLPPLVAWLAPGIIGGLIISRVLKNLKDRKVIA